MRLSLVIPLAIIPIVFSACSRQCIVVDSDGLPLAGATVHVTSMSVGGGSVATDFRGIADVYFIGGPYALDAEKAGYAPKHVLVMGRTFPVVIILQPALSAPTTAPAQ